MNDSSTYRQIPMLPLRGVLVFPYTVIHLDVGRKRSINAIEEAMLDTKEIFLATQKDAQTDDPDISDIYTVGTVAEIRQILKMPGGTMRVLVEGLYRAEVKEYLPSDSYLHVSIIEYNDEEQEKTAQVEAIMRTLVSQFEQFVRMSKKIPPETVVSVVSIEEPGRLADVIASHLSLRIDEKQKVLARDVYKRLNYLCELLAKEMEVLELERKINIRVRKQMRKLKRILSALSKLKPFKRTGEKDERASVENYGKPY